MLTGCKSPKATIVKDEVKENIPLNFQSGGQQDTVQNSGKTPWRQFFTDPNLVALIETALKNNQELLITLQEIEIAKSGVLYKNGKLSPDFCPLKLGAGTADARQLQALLRIDKNDTECYLDIANLMSKVKNIDQYYKMKSQETQALDESIEIANQLFKNSRADYLEVLLNQRDALDAKLELIEAKQKQLSTVVDIYKGLGGGWK
ncbi:hypothetical protein FQR65_LT16653 [Abscondita terminalis]|nr:hypothetical protein FQR65_LT16653 [Abscondita terminalis]